MVSTRLRLSVFAALASLPALFPITPTAAQNPEQQYLTERDRMRVMLKASEDDKKHQEALADLNIKLHAIVGPVEIKGMQDMNEMRPGSLANDIGANALDSIVFRKSPRDYTTLIQVSTETLLARWLAEQQTKYTGPERKAFAVPANMTGALVSERFYASAIDDGAAVEILMKLPVKKHLEAKHVVAILEGRTQGAPVALPDHLIVTAVQGGLVFIAEAPLKMKFSPLEACAGNVDEQGFPTAEYKKCFAVHAPKYKAYIAAAKQAQELYDSFPLRTATQR